MRFRIVHNTSYRYPSEVSASYGEAHLVPRETPRQQVVFAELSIQPSPVELREREDYFGNKTTFFSVLTGHRRLDITASSVVDIVDTPPQADVLLPMMPWETLRSWTRGERHRASDPKPIEADEMLARELAMASPAVDVCAAVAQYARPSFPEGAPVVDCVRDLSRRIHLDFAYRPGTTSVQTTLPEVLERRSGVCQDFAHLGIGCLRAMGLPARYVSGYLETLPPPGQQRLIGADVSHAWLSTYIPGFGWFDIDPTNDQVAGQGHIVTAWGRDYTDVPPLKGVIFTESPTSELTVTVDVIRDALQ